jgi:histidinol-phosphate phosphatase family protein
VGRAFVFLDRDGTLVRDPGYVHRPEDFELLPGTLGGLTRLQRAGFALAIVTNQSGIGRGYFGEADFHAFQARLLGELAGAGIPIEASYFCPHRPEDGCACRKPATGMLERAARELGAALARSWVIGDSDADRDLAARAGCRFVRIDPAGAAEPGAPRAADLEAAAAHILDAARAEEPQHRR